MKFKIVKFLMGIIVKISTILLRWCTGINIKIPSEEISSEEISKEPLKKERREIDRLLIFVDKDNGKLSGDSTMRMIFCIPLKIDEKINEGRFYEIKKIADGKVGDDIVLFRRIGNVEGLDDNGDPICDNRYLIPGGNR